LTKRGKLAILVTRHAMKARHYLAGKQVK
jgi:hypothetical protein